MNGPRMNYEKYLKSLENTPEPIPTIKPCPLDYEAIIAYAKEKGVAPHELSMEEKLMFTKNSEIPSLI